MLDLLKYVVQTIVKNKDDVQVVEGNKGPTKVFNVKVNSADLGAVIGKGGATAQAIRTLVKSMDSHSKIIIKFDSLE